MLELEIRNISKAYGHIKAADNVSFKITEGESVGLVGESGCGKSSLAGLITGLVKADGGEIIYNGKAVNFSDKKNIMEYRKNVQLIFQESSSSLNPRLTAGQSIAEPIENFTSLDKNQRLEAVKHVLKHVGLKDEDAHKFPKQFSGGQRQRIAIARSLVTSPKFLLLDEVTSSLDVSIQAQILNLLLDLKNKYNTGSLFISHDLGVVKYMCDKILVMYKGCIIETISAENINNARHPYSRLLLESVPYIGNNILGQKIPVITDSSLPKNFKGCVFYSRCSNKKDECKNRRPELTEISAGHKVACLNI